MIAKIYQILYQFFGFLSKFQNYCCKIKKKNYKKREKKISILIKMITVINGKLLPLPGSEISEMLTSSWGDIYNPLIGNRRVQFFPLGLMQY